MDFSLKPGLTKQLVRTVEDQYTATHVGSGTMAVLATPAMIAFMEAASMEAVQPYLPEGYQTVGVQLDVRHIAPTPLGMQVTFHAELIEAEGRVLTFRVRADDEKEKVGEGTHKRAIIELARFQDRVRVKSQGMSPAQRRNSPETMK
jgi:fluoroacetyl-CoA thioesterase